MTETTLGKNEIFRAFVQRIRINTINKIAATNPSTKTLGFYKNSI